MPKSRDKPKERRRNAPIKTCTKVIEWRLVQGLC